MNKKFETYFGNMRIRGIYRCSDDVTDNVMNAAVAYCAAELLDMGNSAARMCSDGKLLSQRIKRENGFQKADIYIRVDDISPKPVIFAKKIIREWVCTCGKSNKNNFCVACGVPRTSLESRFCTKCGTRSQKGDLFCGSCGTKF